jgi:hypothetical protein
MPVWFAIVPKRRPVLPAAGRQPGRWNPPGPGQIAASAIAPLALRLAPPPGKANPQKFVIAIALHFADECASQVEV